MTYALLFKVANLSVIPAWVLLVFLPRKKVTKWVSHSYLYPVILALLYIYLMVVSWGGEGGMNTLESLKLSFARDEILVLGWVHYLVFDLFIGAWISRDSFKNNIPHLQIVLPLLLTLFAGPIGLLTYLVIRFVHLKKLNF